MNKDVADVPDIESRFAFGASSEHALAEVEQASRAWVDAAPEIGKPIRAQRYRLAIYQAGR